MYGPEDVGGYLYPASNFRPKALDSLYIIGSLRNRNVIEIANRIRAMNIEAFDDWISPGEEADDKWKEYSEARGHTYKEALKGWAAKHVFEFDKAHLDRTDGAVLVLPAGKSCHLEFGYTIGKGKPGFVLMDSPDRWDVMYQFATNIAFTPDELLQQIEQYRASLPVTFLPGSVTIVR